MKTLSSRPKVSIKKWKLSCIWGYVPIDVNGNAHYRLASCSFPKPSFVIERFNIKPGDRVVLVLRVSSRVQERSKNLDDQERRLRLAVKKAGGKVVDVVRKTTSGYYFDWLFVASYQAQQKGAILLAESTSRFVRNVFYHSSKRPSLGPSFADLRNLRSETRGLRLMTLVDPDASFREERSQQTKRGLEAKSRRGKGLVGASQLGAIKERRTVKLARVLELHEQGWSSRDIELETGVPKTTVNRWLSKV